MFATNDIRDLHNLEDYVRDYPKIQGFLELLAPSVSQRICNVPVRHYSEDNWNSLPWSKWRLTSAPIACFQNNGTDQLIMLKECSNPNTRSYNVAHEALHAAFHFDHELMDDYTRCHLMSELGSQPEDYRQDYCILHTMLLFKIFLFGSRSARTLELLAAHRSEKKWKSEILAEARSVSWEELTGVDLHEFSRLLVNRVMDIASRQDALGCRFSRVLTAIPNVESEEFERYVGSHTWTTWSGWRQQE